MPPPYGEPTASGTAVLERPRQELEKPEADDGPKPDETPTPEVIVEDSPIVKLRKKLGLPEESPLLNTKEIDQERKLKVELYVSKKVQQELDSHEGLFDHRKKYTERTFSPDVTLRDKIEKAIVARIMKTIRGLREADTYIKVIEDSNKGPISYRDISSERVVSNLKTLTPDELSTGIARIQHLGYFFIGHDLGSPEFCHALKTLAQIDEQNFQKTYQELNQYHFIKLEIVPFDRHGKLSKDTQTLVEIVKNGGPSPAQREKLEIAKRFALLTGGNIPVRDENGKIAFTRYDDRLGLDYLLTNGLTAQELNDLLFVTEDRVYHGLVLEDVYKNRPPEHYSSQISVTADRSFLDQITALQEHAPPAVLAEVIRKGVNPVDFYRRIAHPWRTEQFPNDIRKAHDMVGNPDQLEMSAIFRELMGEKTINLEDAELCAQMYEQRELLTNIAMLLQTLPRQISPEFREIIQVVSQDGRQTVQIDTPYLAKKITEANIHRYSMNPDDQKYIQVIDRLFVTYIGRGPSTGERYIDIPPETLPTLSYFLENKQMLLEFFDNEGFVTQQFIENAIAGKIPVGREFIKHALSKNIEVIDRMDPELITANFDLFDRQTIVDYAKRLSPERLEQASDNENGKILQIVGELEKKYPTASLRQTGEVTITASVGRKALDLMLAGKVTAQELRTTFHEREQDEFSVIGLILKGHEAGERTAQEKPDVQKDSILKDAEGFAKLSVLFNDSKYRFTDTLLEKIYGRGVLEEIKKIKKIAGPVDEVELEAVINMIDFQSDVLRNRFAVLFHGTNAEGAGAIASGSSQRIGNRATTGAFVSSRESISYFQYASARDTISGAQQGTKGGMILYPREYLAQAHAEGLRNYLNEANGYFVNNEGMFTRVPDEAAINITGASREEYLQNLYQALRIIQEAKRTGLAATIAERFREFGTQDALVGENLEKMYAFMRQKNYPEAKIVEVRDAYLLTFMKSLDGDSGAKKQFDVYNQLLSSYGQAEITEKADIAMICDIFKEYPDSIERLEIGMTPSATEKRVQIIIQEKQEEEFRKAVDAMRPKDSSLYSRYRQVARTVKRYQKEGAIAQEINPLLSLQARNELILGEINGENVARIHEGVRNTLNNIQETNISLLQVAEKNAFGKLDESHRRVLERYKPSYSVVGVGSLGRGTMTFSSDLDYVLYCNDEQIPLDDIELAEEALKQLNTLIGEELSGFGIKKDDARMNQVDLVKMSQIREMTIQLGAERQVIEPTILLDAVSVDNNDGLVASFQKRLFDISDAFQKFIATDIQRRNLSWTYSVSELLSGDSIKDFKQDINRTVDWTVFLLIASHMDKIKSRGIDIPGSTFGKIDLLKNSEVINEEQAEQLNSAVTDINRWRMRADILSQGNTAARFNPMLMTNRERQRFVDYARFVNDLLPEQTREGIKNNIITV